MSSLISKLKFFTNFKKYSFQHLDNHLSFQKKKKDICIITFIRFSFILVALFIIESLDFFTCFYHFSFVYLISLFHGDEFPIYGSSVNYSRFI